MRFRKLAPVAGAALLAVLAAAAPALAASSDVLFVNACTRPTQYIAALEARPEIGTVTRFDAQNGTPTPEQLAANGLVISGGDCWYDDPATLGNRLADYVDGRGHVLQYAFDGFIHNGYKPAGRFLSGGYAPLINSVAGASSGMSLGTYDADHPLMRGVHALDSQWGQKDSQVAPGAELVASWSDGGNAVAAKGNVSSVSANLDNGQRMER